LRASRRACAESIRLRAAAWPRRRARTYEETDMYRTLLRAGAAIAIATSLAGAAYGAASDYAFEAVKSEVRKGDDVIVAVRLVHKPTGKPVTDAVIVQTRIDMAPDGMGEMAPPLTPLPSPEPGVYAFKTELSMAGRWLLSVAAKVQGEPETVVGKITLRVTK
jgi:hypothetical protein